MKALKSCNINTEVLLEDDGHNLDQFKAKYVEASTENYTYKIDQANIKKIVFRPRFFGMTTTDKLKYVTLKTKTSGPSPSNANIYARICNNSDSAVVGISKMTYWPGTVDTLVSFEFDPISFSSVDNKYYIEFLDSDKTTVRNELGVRLNLLTNGQTVNDPDYYTICRPQTSEEDRFNWRPICFFSILHYDSSNNAYIIQNNDIKNSKLNTSVFAPEFDQTSSYYAGTYVTYNGNVYAFITDHVLTGSMTLKAWDTTEVSVVSMTSPDAAFDVLSYGGLRLVNTADNTLLWQQGYNLSSTSSTQLKNESVNYFEFDVNATSAATMIMPARTPGKVSDFVLDIKNPDLTGDAFDQTSTYSQNDVVVKDNYQWKALTAIAANTAWNAQNWEQLPYPQITISNDLDITMAAYIPSNDMLSDMFTIAPGETSELYFTQTAFTKTVDSKQLPVYKIIKQTITDGGSAE